MSIIKPNSTLKSKCAKSFYPPKNGEGDLPGIRIKSYEKLINRFELNKGTEQCKEENL